MGNAISPCCTPPRNSSVIKLVFYEGNTKTLNQDRLLAGEVVLRSPDRVVCHSDSFFVGCPIPSLSLEDELIRGETYFVLPTDRFPCQTLSATSLSALAPNSCKGDPIRFGRCPFQYVRGSDGQMLIKVLPEFIMELMLQDGEKEHSPSSDSPLCSTPELKKHYAQLVGSKEQLWLPKLETIAESKAGFWPSRILRLERLSRR